MMQTGNLYLKDATASCPLLWTVMAFDPSPTSEGQGINEWFFLSGEGSVWSCLPVLGGNGGG